MGIDYKFDLMLSEDGSGRGAALVAAVLKRGEKEAQSLGWINELKKKILKLRIMKRMVPTLPEI